MEIMPTTSKNFELLANTIVDGFFSNGTPLAKGIVRVAKDQDLNPEEIKRLVEKTNTNASIKFLSSSSTNHKESFELADYHDVLSQTHAVDEEDEPEEDLTKESSEKDWYKTNYSSYQRGKAAAQCNIFFSQFQEPQVKTASTKNDSLEKYKVLNQELDNAAFTKMAAETTLRNSINKLIKEYENKSDYELSKFASEVVETFGTPGAIVMRAVGAHLDRDIELVKTASYIDDTNPMVKVAEEACQSLESLDVLSKMIPFMKQAKTHFWSDACNVD